MCALKMLSSITSAWKEQGKELLEDQNLTCCLVAKAREHSCVKVSWEGRQPFQKVFGFLAGTHGKGVGETQSFLTPLEAEDELRGEAGILGFVFLSLCPLRCFCALRHQGEQEH